MRSCSHLCRMGNRIHLLCCWGSASCKYCLVWKRSPCASSFCPWVSSIQWPIEVGFYRLSPLVPSWDASGTIPASEISHRVDGSLPWDRLSLQLLSCINLFLFLSFYFIRHLCPPFTRVSISWYAPAPWGTCNRSRLEMFKMCTCLCTDPPGGIIYSALVVTLRPNISQNIHFFLWEGVWSKIM